MYSWVVGDHRKDRDEYRPYPQAQYIDEYTDLDTTEFSFLFWTLSIAYTWGAEEQIRAQSWALD